jgi:SNF2 family DNA or RNA helicase
MIALHAGFGEGHLRVWGESSEPRIPSDAKAREHPFACGPEELREVLPDIGISPGESNFKTREVLLPSYGRRPVSSSPLIGEIPRKHAAADLTRWTVTTAELEPAAAIDLLCRCVDRTLLEPGVIAGADLQYWAAAMRFAAGLVARQQFLPDVSEENGKFRACWRAVCLGRDDDRRQTLIAAMPGAARALAPEICTETLLDGFLDAIVDHLVRSSAVAEKAAGKSLHDRWLSALNSADGVLADKKQETLQEFCSTVRAWRRPIAMSAGAPYRLCFRLEEPEGGSDAWQVRYLLQARHDPSLLVPTAAVWDLKSGKAPIWNHPGFRPREYLLFSLGQVSRICPRTGESLKSPAPEGYELDATGAHEFLTERAIAIEEAGFGVMLPAWWTRRGTRARLSAGVRVKSPFQHGGGLSLGALLNFEWNISIGGQKLTLAELKALAKLKAPLVKFRGEWVQLSAGEIQAALDFWKKKGTGQITAREAVRMALGATTTAGPLEFSGISAEGWLADLLEQLQGNTPFEQAPPPEGLRANLRPYQVRGYSWLAFLRRWGFGACLADDMGLGKTIQTLSLIQRDWDGKRPVLLICPTSVIRNWQKEAQRFTPGLPVMVHHGAARTRGESFAEQASRHAIVISSYALLPRDFELLSGVEWGGVVLDEAQNVKNAGTRQSIAARQLKADYRVALTGTPVENNVGDLWSIMEFLNPGLLGTRAEFKRNYYVPIQTAQDEQVAAALKSLTGPFILRRLKTDKSVISDLPDKLEVKTFCTLTKEQASLYAAVVEESVRAIESAEGIQRKGVVLATLARLKQVCNHPAQFLQDNSPLPGRSGKLARLTEMVEEAIAEGDRTLVFSQFAEMGEMLRRHLQATFGREMLFLHGGVPRKQRDRMVERFQEEQDGPPVFILSLKAGGTGLNLTRASRVFHFDRWWNPAVENQATDRAFRIGQKKNVQVYKFVCAGTLEERIDEMITHKGKIAADVVGTGEGWLTELSTSQLKSLFALQKAAVAE